MVARNIHHGPGGSRRCPEAATLRAETMPGQPGPWVLLFWVGKLRFPLKDSLKGDMQIGIDRAIDTDIDRYRYMAVSF